MEATNGALYSRGDMNFQGVLSAWDNLAYGPKTTYY